MPLQSIKKIGIIGAGTMGRGIAQVFALYDYSVILVDREDFILTNALKKINERTEPELQDKILNHIDASTDIEEVSDCDLVVEAVFEDIEAKKKILKNLNMVCKKQAIIATNTSSFPINELASGLDNPSCFIGMHFMNPPKRMKLIEIIKGAQTSEDTVRTITDLAKTMEKVPAIVSDSPGFVSNRLLFALIGEAVRLLEKGAAGKEDIDKVMKYGMNHPMGPIELADFIGLDVCLDIMNFLYESLGDIKYKPSCLLESLVKDKKLGKKTGEGFYQYTKTIHPYP